MTPAEVKKTRLYRTLSPCIVKKDREELARMLAMIQLDDYMTHDFRVRNLREAITWLETPQGWGYWSELSNRLKASGHDCY